MSPFSNHFPSNFQIEGIEFNCCEQFYMYSKALHFNDKQQADNILKATDPVTQKNWDLKSLDSRRMCGIKNLKM